MQYVDLLGAEPVIGSYQPDAIYLGRLFEEDGPAEKLMYGGDQHVVVIGPNGKGKSVSILFPNLLRIEDRSLVVVDIKGELAAVSALYRSTVSKVKIINPFGLHADRRGYEFMESSGFNPLGYLDPEADDFNRKAGRLAEAMIEIGPEVRDPHWPLSARSMLAAIIMFVVIEGYEKNRVPSMRRVRELLCDASEPPSRAYPEGRGLPALAAEMVATALRNLWAGPDYTGMRNKASQFMDYTREVASIASTARIETEPFDDPEIARDMEAEPFDFSFIKSDPTSVYIILPPHELERHSKWMRLVLTAAFDGVMRPREANEPKTLFILDEFYALGRLEIVATVWALVRGFGIQILPVLQDLKQLEKLYPDLWQTFIGMAGAVISFAANDHFTQDWLVKQAGETTRNVRSTSTTESYQKNTGENTGYNSGTNTNPNIVGLGTSSSKSYGTSTGESYGKTSATTTSKTKVQVITPQTIRGLPPGHMLLVLDGMKNLYPVYAPPYMDIEMMMDRACPNPYHNPS